MARQQRKKGPTVSNMNKVMYRYQFKDRVRLQDAEETLLLSIFAAMGIHGEARVRMDCGYALDEVIRVIVVDAGTTVGRDVNAIFSALAMREFGPLSFQVRRVEGLSEVKEGKHVD